VDEMLKHHPNPNLKQTTVVARKIVNEYPDSLEDRTDQGHRIGTGCASLVKQLKNRIDNVNRGDNTARLRCARKRQVHENEDNETESSIDVRSVKPKDSYGCVNWRRHDVPSGETIESLREAQTALKNQYALGPEHWDVSIIDELMSKTYYIQWEDITEGA
jgi:hypothetical protein